jgi:UDP-N-acetylglucosamine diphosphorylase / glucose-1-phosphate thymidylyltransferase / UDP-N-acetylgalactosamine diphosphorylase / glucosamine-1-phosphate N-acetyltransferase / galactosamine-1-phosphate N-acetyltransferase
MSDIKAVLLVAGNGNRMRPLTDNRPKVMLTLANKPILEHLLIELKNAGLNDFIFIVGYKDDTIRNYFGDGGKWGVKISYCSQQHQIGTADALRQVKPMVGSRFVVVNGDVIIEGWEIRKFLNSGDNALCLTELDNASDLGVVEVNGQLITRIHEKVASPPTNLVNAGIYLFSSEIFEAIDNTPKSKRGEYELTDSINLMAGSGKAVSFLKLAHWMTFTYPWDLLKANERLLISGEARRSGLEEQNVVIKGPVSIGDKSVIKSGVYIVGPVIIGQNCEIGPNCYIRPATSIADNCHIGAGVEVKNSIIMKGTKIPHLSYVGDSIIGEYCNLGAGTKIANLRFDKQNISANGVTTNTRKMGAIIGDHVETGINSSINTGTLIGAHSIVGPGAVASGVISPYTKIL